MKLSLPLPLQSGGDTISSLSVGKESQLLPGQQEEKERHVHGRCPVLWGCLGALVDGHGASCSPLSALC